MQKLADTLPSPDDSAKTPALLRDGSVGGFEVGEPSDHDAVRRFFRELSPESRRRRFFSIAEPSDALVTRLCDSSNLASAATLLALRTVDGEVKPIAVASYVGVGSGSAEAAFAVDDRFQGKGIGT